MTRPGDGVRAFASRLFAAETMERVIDPIVADLQCEYDERLAGGRVWRARLSLLRSYVALARAMFQLGVRPRSDMARTCIVSVLAAVVMTVALVIPPLLTWPRWRGDPGFTALLLVTLLPQALPLSIPAGLCVAVLWAMRGKVATWRRVGTVLGIALACTVIVWAVLEWVMPAANQGFRELVAARLSDGRAVTLERGPNELGLSRLSERSDPAAVRQYQVLWAICFASAPLGLLAVALARYVRRAASAVALALALCNFYYVILWICAASKAGPTLATLGAAWAPNVVCVLLGSALLVRPHRPVALSRGRGPSGRQL
jgi:hypothetical protein